MGSRWLSAKTFPYLCTYEIRTTPYITPETASKAAGSSVLDTAQPGNYLPCRNMRKRILRFLTIVAVAIWFGGFTFYSTVVIATAQEVLHSHLRAGLITQQVTRWLNLVSLVPL